MGFKECVTPRTWVLRDEIEFAPSLGDVYLGTAPEVYRDPGRFFEVTYVTYTMKEILGNIASVLSGRGGNRVFPLATVFGGGKTHTLIFLYHAVKHPEKLPKGLPQPPRSNVVVLDFTKLEVGPNVRGSVTVYTPWGELAYQLNSYGGLIKDLDEKMVPPAEEVLRRLLEPKQPLLILMDEITHYLRRASGVKVGETTLAKQTVAFLQSLLAVVKKLDRCAIVLTFPEAEAEYEEESRGVAEVIREAGYVILRVASPEQPLSREELREIVKKWLFENIRPHCASNTASNYFDYYRERAEAFPEEVNRPGYKDLVERSYPFHPSLIDMLFERIAAIPRFQRTRGALMLLHKVVQRLYGSHEDPAIIMPYHIDLLDDRIRSILLRATESDEAQKYVTIIQQDIVNKDGNARAQQIDPKLGPRAATCVFLSSFTLAAKDVRRISPTARDVALMMCGINDNPYEVFEVLKKLADKLHYMDEDEGRYFFRTRPAINKLIEDYRNTVSSKDTEEKVVDTLFSLKGSSSVFRIAVIEQEYPDDAPQYRITISRTPLKHEEIEKIYGYKSSRGEAFRQYKNALILVVPDEFGLEQAGDAARTVIAIVNLLEDIERVVPEDYVQSYKKKLDQRKKQAESDLTSKVLAAFSYIVYPCESAGGSVELKLEKMTAQGSSIAEIVEKHLEKAGKLLREVSYRWLWDRVISRAIELAPKDVNVLGFPVKAVQVKDLLTRFYEDQRLPIVPESAVLKALVEGTGKAFALANEAKIYLDEAPPSTDAIRNHWILQLDVAKELSRKLRERVEESTEARPATIPPVDVVGVQREKEIAAPVVTVTPPQLIVGDIVVRIEIDNKNAFEKLRLHFLPLIPLPPECRISVSGKRRILGQKEPGVLAVQYEGPIMPEPTVRIVDKIGSLLRQIELVKGEWIEFKAVLTDLSLKVEEDYLQVLRELEGKITVRRSSRSGA